MLTAFLKELRLIRRDRWLFVLSLIVPVVVISLIAAALLGTGSGPRLRIAIVDEDHSPTTAAFTEALAEYADVVPLSRPEAEGFVGHERRGPVAVVFPAGLAERYRKGLPTEVTLLTDPGQQRELRAARTLLMLMEKQARTALDPFAEELIEIEEQNLTGTKKNLTSFEQNVPGFALMFVLISVLFSTATGLHHEREWGTLARMLVAPVGLVRLLLGSLGARVVFGSVQMIALLVWIRLAFDVSFGSSPAAVLLLTGAVVLATAATGLVIAAVATTREQTQPLGLAVVIVLSGLGGLWWPPSMTPAWLRTFSPAVYTTWAMQGLNDLVLRDRGLAAMVPPVTVLILYSAVASMLGIALLMRRHAHV